MGKIVENVENISINLYCIDFFYCNKKLQKIDKNFCTDLINNSKVIKQLLYTIYIYRVNS